MRTTYWAPFRPVNSSNPPLVSWFRPLPPEAPEDTHPINQSIDRSIDRSITHSLTHSLVAIDWRSVSTSCQLLRFPVQSHVHRLRPQWVWLRRAGLERPLEVAGSDCLCVGSLPLVDGCSTASCHSALIRPSPPPLHHPPPPDRLCHLPPALR